MHKNARFRFVTSTLAALLFSVFCLSVLASRESVRASAKISTPPPSTGFLVLADAHEMDKAGMAGEEIVFDPEDFARALDLSAVPSLTVTALPSVTDGELRLGSARVSAGQRIPRGELDRLAFVPASDRVRRAAFTFRVGESGYDIRCELHLLTTPNAAPAIAPTDPVGGICEHMSLRGQLAVTDPEGDSVRCLLVTPPAHGSLLWLDAEQGIYLYQPAAGFAGEDRFAVVAVDAWGNTSVQCHITVRVGVCGVEE